MTEAVFAHPFAASFDAPATARRFVRNVVEALAAAVDIDVAVLLASELVTNVVEHARTDGTLHVRLGETFRVEVCDQRPDLACRVDDADRDPTAERGLGLCLVDQLATRWGCEAEPYAKTVWFELSYRDDDPEVGLA